MKKTEKKLTHFIVDNLIKIMNDRKLKKVDFANLIEFPEAKWNKISNGNQLLNVDELSKIASKLCIREIDILTFPKVYIEQKQKDSDRKTLLTVELNEEKREQVLKIVFGDSYKEILK